MEDKDIIVYAGESAPDKNAKEKFVPHNPLNRPKISYKKPIITMLCYVAQITLLIPIPYGEWWIRAAVLTLFSLAYFSFIAKRTVIWLVHLYQNKASDATRLKCTFEPSCSEYMILAVNKYGVIKGVAKGINRLFRCGSESGIDYP